MTRTAIWADDDRLDSAKLTIGLLGPLMVLRGDRDLEVPGPKRRALLTLLALNAGRPLGRDQIVDVLWPHRQTGREESTLRTHVSYLRDEIEQDRQHDPVFLLTRGQAYMLDADRIQLDVDRFRRLLEEGRTRLEGRPDQALALFDEALALWRGRPLQDVEYEDFAQDEIRNLETARVEVVVDRALALIALGDLGAAVTALEPVVRDRLDWEEPAVLLMSGLYGTGRHADALRVARRHRRHLAEQGLEPSPRLVEVEDQILNHDANLGMFGGGGAAEGGGGARGYELRHEAGEGSIGVVYRAFQPSVGREVALKVIHPHLARSADFVRRFSDEARVVAGLEHPHIVPLYDFWRDPSGAFMVMRWMAGGSLADRLRRSWDASELVRVFDQVSNALSYAHSAGIVHRDVKAANVLFDGSGNAYLSDFGLATWGVETGSRTPSRSRALGQPYVSPEILRGEGPTVASDIYGLGALLALVSEGFDDDDELVAAVSEVVRVATAVNPADRYPDVDTFRRALSNALGDVPTPLPRHIRRNPFKGLSPFDEGDAADFYGRDEFIERLLDVVASRSLTSVVAASGTGKSSLIRAGLIPELKKGAIAGSDEWFMVTMVPGTEPFDEFHVGLRAAAMTDTAPSSHAPNRELRAGFDASLDGPSSKALLFIDQFEELFSSDVDPRVRERFLENLVDLATDPVGRVRTVVTLRADFSDRPLSHPRFGGMMAKSSLMLGPMTADELEDVIRLPAARVGVEAEPGLVSEIIRDISAAPASLPLLQYVLTELFERRSEDRLTVHVYRALGGIRGVLERQAENSFNSLSAEAKSVCREVFLRTVHLGDHGEETRRRVALSELPGLGDREAIDQVVDSFTTARILTTDRDPISRAPTIEVSHETVINRWTRLRVWIDESRSDMTDQRRIAVAADTWTRSQEDPEYLLTGGPLAAAVELSDARQFKLNEVETRFVEASRRSAARAEAHEQERQRHEAELQHQSQWRLAIGIGTAVIAAIVTILAGFAWFERQRANDLAAAQERQSAARELAATAMANLNSPDPDLSLLLAIEAAELAVDAGEAILPEVVEALHRAVIEPRPVLTISGALGDSDGLAVSYSADGSLLAYVTDQGTVAVVDPVSGAELHRTDRVEPEAIGVDFHPEQARFMSIHGDGVREWVVGSDEIVRRLAHPATVTTATYSDDGRLVAIGDETGTVTVYEGAMASATLLGEHQAWVTSVDFDPTGTKLVSTGFDSRVLVWDLDTGSVATEPELRTAFCVFEASWHPTKDEVLVTLCHGEAFAFNPTSGARLRPFSQANQVHNAMVYDSSGTAVVGAGADGFTRIFNAEVGGSSVIEVPSGGAPVDDVEFSSRDPGSLEVAAVGADGVLQVWRDSAAWTELSHRFTGLFYPFIDATPDGRYYVVGGNSLLPGAPTDCLEVVPVVYVIDAVTESVLATADTFCTIGRLHQAAISADGALVAAAGPSGNVSLLDVASGESIEIPDSASWALDVDFSSDRRMLAGVDGDGQVAVWDVESLTRTRLMGQASAPEGAPPLLSDRGSIQVEFVPGAAEVVATELDGSLRVWNVVDGTSRVIEVFGSRLSSMDVSSDGERVVAADITGNLRMLDLGTGEEILPRPQSVPGQTSVVMSPDGRYLAGGGPGPVVYLWDLGSGEIVRQLGRAIGSPTVAFVNGGREIRAASLEGIVRGYVLDPVELLAIAKKTVGRELTDKECQRHLRRTCRG